MSFTNELRAARQSPIAAFHEFKLNYNPERALWHCFVEGQTDQGFYLPVISRYVPDSNLRFYRCGNKRAVLDTLARIRANYPACVTALFFVDKDLSDLVASDAHGADSYLYVTDVYSIENYLVNEAVLLRLIQETFRMAAVSFDVSVFEIAFRRSVKLFYRFMMPVMAWIIVAKRAGARPNVNNVQIAKVVSLDTSMNVVPRMTWFECNAYMASATGLPAPLQSSDCRLVYKEIRARNPAEIVRGKFLAWFFIQFLNRVEESMKVAASEVGGSVTVTTLLHARNFVEVLGGRCQPPGRLLSFLDAHMGNERRRST